MTGFRSHLLLAFAMGEVRELYGRDRVVSDLTVFSSRSL